METTTDPPIGNDSPLSYDARRRAVAGRQHRAPLWVKVVDGLLAVLVCGDFANLFQAVETAVRSDYAVILAITVSLTAMCVLIPFLAGKLWRRRARGSSDATYLLVAILLIAWAALLVGITQLRLAVESSALTGAIGMGSGAGSAIASLGAASTGLHTGSAEALTWLLTAMLAASGMVAFASAYAAADPLRDTLRRAESQKIELAEALEDLAAAQQESLLAAERSDDVIKGDTARYEAAQQQVEERARYLKQLVRTRLAEGLRDPASTSLLTQAPVTHQDEGNNEGDNGCARDNDVPASTPTNTTKGALLWEPDPIVSARH